MFLRVFFLISALCMTGCAGAGGYNDLAPKVIHYGSPTTMQIELYKWGSGSDKLDKRFANITLYYRVVGKHLYNAIPMTPTLDQGKYTAQAVLPAFSPEQGNEVEYYIDLTLDGVYNNGTPKRIPLV